MKGGEYREVQESNADYRLEDIIENLKVTEMQSVADPDIRLTVQFIMFSSISPLECAKVYSQTLSEAWPDLAPGSAPGSATKCKTPFVSAEIWKCLHVCRCTVGSRGATWTLLPFGHITRGR